MSEWIEWKGGECPVPGETVSVKFRGSDFGTRPGTADFFDWSHDGTKINGDIIAYRVVKEKEE